MHGNGDDQMPLHLKQRLWRREGFPSGNRGPHGMASWSLVSWFASAVRRGLLAHAQRHGSTQHQQLLATGVASRLRQRSHRSA